MASGGRHSDGVSAADAARNEQTLSLPLAPVSQDALRTEERGGFWDLLDALKVALVLSRERENFLQFVAAPGGHPWQSTLTIAQPTGVFYHTETDSLLVGTTRIPNQLVLFEALTPARVDPDILPAGFEPPRLDREHLYLPTRCRFLPGALYTHDVVRMGADVFVLATDHNFVARIGAEGGWQRVWWPQVLDDLPADAFRINRMQLNAIAAGASLEQSWFTAFSDEMTGPKPWRQGYGPDRRGVVIAGGSRATVTRGLTCPHSIRLHGGRLWVCNSGYGELVVTGPADGPGVADWDAVVQVPGFARGLCFAGDYAFVGLSKVAEGFEHYAPGVDAPASRCGISAVHLGSGTVVAELWWPAGHEIYDIQVVPGSVRPLFPEREDEHGVNVFLRYLG